MTRLLGKTALITGGARGIGRAFAQAYLQNGARVAIADIDRDLCQATATALGDQALAVHMDVSDPASITQAVDQTIAAFGQIDILINNAAVCFLPPLSSRSLPRIMPVCSTSMSKARCSPFRQSRGI